MRQLIIVLTLLGLGWAQPYNPERGDLRVVLLSDINGSYGSVTYAPGVLRAIEYTVTIWQPELFLSAGDVIAGQSQQLPTVRFAEMWQAFDTQIALPLRRADIPYAVALGNHDASSLTRSDGSYIFAREREAARSYWQQPMYQENLNYLERQDFPFHYSFVIGEVFVAVIDASSARFTPQQQAWLEAQLAAPQAQSARVRLVVGHLPLYGVAEGRNRPGEVLDNGDDLRRLMERYRTDVYISGHHHAYYPARRGELRLLNTGGAPPRRLLGDNRPARSTVTVMDIHYQDAEIRLTTFDLATWQVIDLAELPERIDGLGGSLRRWDIDWD
jgi:hypothetical protein